MLKRRLIMGLLGLGVLVGYGSTLAHLGHHRGWHRQQIMGEFARTCVEAARADRAAPPPSR